MAEELGRREEEVDCEQTENPAEHTGRSHQARPLARTPALVEPQEGGEKGLTAHTCNHSEKVFK